MDKGLKTLLEYFRSFKEPLTDEQKKNIELAKSEGYMFDYPQTTSHVESMERLSYLLTEIDRKRVADAFLFSLSTRRLEYRSALGSYYFAIAIPLHEHEPDSYNRCAVCGWEQWDHPNYKYDGFNYISYCRYKYGKVGLKLNATLFDLEQFVKLPEVSPASEDYEILKLILGCTRRLSGGNDRVAKLTKAVIHEKILKTNKDEVDNLLESLSVCGVLNNREHPSFEEKFVGYEEMRYLEFSEYSYPVNMWRARDGVNLERLKEVFGIEL